MKHALLPGLLLCLSLSLTSVAPVMAASSPVDVAAIAETVTRVDPNRLLAGLRKAPSGQELPRGFTKAELNRGQPGAPDCDVMGGINLDSMGGGVGGATFNVTGDAGELGTSVSTNLLQYLVLDPRNAKQNTADALQFCVEQELPATYTVKQMHVAGVLAVVYEFEIDPAALGVGSLQYTFFVPVGNIVVSATVALGGDKLPPAAQVRAPAMALATAGIVHVGKVAEAIA